MTPREDNRERGIRLACGFLLLLFLAGAFFPGSWTWGFNALAYLPRWLLIPWSAAALCLAWPRALASLARALFRASAGAARWPRWAAGLVPLAAAAVFWLLRTRTFLLGDGSILGQLLDEGVPFRGLDNLDYLAHSRAFFLLRGMGLALSPFTVYQVGSVLAGFAAVILWHALLRRMPDDSIERKLALGMLFLAGPVVLYMGYVESYTFLFLFLTAFLIAGLLALEGRASLWLASSLFGLAAAAHLSALVSAPSLIYLALRAPAGRRSPRWLAAALPPVAALLVAAGLHLLAGYDAGWFRREFLESRNLGTAVMPAAGPYGLFSPRHAADLVNLALLVAPVAVAVSLARAGELRLRLRRPGIGFLCTQSAAVAIVAFLIDPKLGGARDWDLLAAQSGGILLLGASLFPAPRPGPAVDEQGPGPLVVFALGAAFLLTLPWALVLHGPTAAVSRLIDAAPGFPPAPRAGAYEEVARYYRKAAEDRTRPEGARAELNRRSEAMYRRAVEAYPSNPRLHILLAGILSTNGNQAESEREYLAALRSGAGNPNVAGMCYEMLGKIALTRRDYSSALDWFHKLVDGHGDQAGAWELLGYAAVGAGRTEEAARAFRRSTELQPLPRTRLALGFSLADLARRAQPAPQRSRLLNEAAEQARAVLALEPENRQARALLDSVSVSLPARPQRP